MINKNKNQKTIGLFFASVAFFAMMGAFGGFWFGQVLASDGESSGQVSTAILPSDWGVENILNAILVTVTVGVGIGATLAILFAGVTYATAAGDSGKVAKAKQMILNTVIGLIAYAFMWAFLRWLIPGMEF